MVSSPPGHHVRGDPRARQPLEGFAQARVAIARGVAIGGHQKIMRLEMQMSADRAMRAQGGSVSSFAKLSGCALPSGLEPVGQANPGLPYALLEIARQGICTLPRVSAGALRRYLEAAAQRLELVPDDNIELFAPNARETLLHAFRDTHDWLSQVTGRIPFFDDLDDMRRPRPISDLAAASAALPALRADAQKHIENLEARTFLETLALPG